MKVETNAKANAKVQPVDNLIKPTVFPFNINPKIVLTTVLTSLNNGLIRQVRQLL